MTVSTLEQTEIHHELMACEELDHCPIFERFRYQESKDFWIRLYCKGSFQPTCQRKCLTQNGRPVPDGMLPNGKILEFT